MSTLMSMLKGSGKMIAAVIVVLACLGGAYWYMYGTKIAPGTPDAPPADQADNGADVDGAAPARPIQVVVTGLPEMPPWQAPKQVPCASDTVMVRGDGKWSLEMGANTWVTWGVTCDGQVFRDKRDMKPVPGACFVPDHLPDAGAWSEEYEQTPACPWRKVLITNPGGADHSGRPSDIAAIGKGTFPEDTDAHLKQIALIAVGTEAEVAAHHPAK